jgi:hypothetical protein
MLAHDPGVSRERTALAWDRTALAIVCGALIISRLTYDRLGLAALLCTAIAVPLAGLVLLEGRGRYARDPGVGPRPRPRGGRAPAALALATLALVLVEGAALLG